MILTYFIDDIILNTYPRKQSIVNLFGFNRDNNSMNVLVYDQKESSLLIV